MMATFGSIFAQLSARRVAAVVVIILLLSGIFALRPAGSEKLTAYFTEAKSIYVGDDVTMRSVPIGKITEIKAEPGRVRVEMKIDNGHALPANVHAAIIGRSLVSVRAIALGPSYNGGPRLAAGATIPISRTTTPVEWDDVKSQLVRLADALGPDGTGTEGSAGRLVESAAGYLKGRGTSINQTVDSLAKALQTLADNRGDLFATVRNLQVFVDALNQSDAQVRSFNTRLAEVSDLLAGDRQDLAAALEGLQTSFVSAERFLRANTDLTASTLDSLDETLSVLAEKRTFLANALQAAPSAISNFYNIIDPRVQAATGELAPANFGSIGAILCGALTALDPEGGDAACRDALGPLVQGLGITSLPVGVSPLPADTADVGGGTTTPDQADLLKKR